MALALHPTSAWLRAMQRHLVVNSQLMPSRYPIERRLDSSIVWQDSSRNFRSTKPRKDAQSRRSSH